MLSRWRVVGKGEHPIEQHCVIARHTGNRTAVQATSEQPTWGSNGHAREAEQGGVRMQTMEPRIGDAFGEILVACQEAGRQPGNVMEIIEREDGYIASKDAARYFVPPQGDQAEWVLSRIRGRSSMSVREQVAIRLHSRIAASRWSRSTCHLLHSRYAANAESVTPSLGPSNSSPKSPMSHLLTVSC